jgi:hypothetical protein
MNSQEVMRKYLREIGQLPLSSEGPDFAGKPARQPTESDNEFLRGLIREQSRVNLGALIFAFSLILMVFIAALATGVKTGNSATSLLSIGGIGTGCEAGLMTWVFRLWREYNRFGFLLILSQRLSPEDLMKAVGAMYFGKETPKGKPAPKKGIKDSAVLE